MPPICTLGGSESARNLLLESTGPPINSDLILPPEMSVSLLSSTGKTSLLRPAVTRELETEPVTFNDVIVPAPKV